MMRAPFNTFMNVYAQPLPTVVPPPGLLRANVQCRIVRQDEITFQGGLFGPLNMWVTYELPLIGVASDGPGLPHQWMIKYGTANVVELPAGSGNYYYVVLGQHVDNGIDPAYGRCFLLPWPMPY